MPVEHPTEQDPQRVPADLGGPTPCRPIKFRTAVEDAPIVGRRCAGMQIQRHAKGFHRRPQLVVFERVQVAAAGSGYAVVHQGPAQSVLGDGALQLRSGRGGVL
jgi:hypothetical protein